MEEDKPQPRRDNPFARPVRKMGPRERAARAALKDDYVKRQEEAMERRRTAPIPVYVPKPVAGCHVFFHPDLGIGGAERLVVDAAVGLKKKGAKVVIYTNHCDPNHCFDECRDGTSYTEIIADELCAVSLLLTKAHRHS